MSFDEVISPSWDQAERFLNDQGASSGTLLDFRVYRTKANKEGKGEMMSIYPVVYGDRNGRNQGFSLDVKMFLIPQRDDFEDLIEQPYNSSIPGADPLYEGTVSDSSKLPDGVKFN